MARAYVGVSGWRYPRWRGDFYPKGLVQRRELEYVASRMTSVEVNGSFYSLLRPSTYQAMVDQTPHDFVVAVKGSRYITHMRKLGNVEVPLANFLASGMLALGHKLGPLLWQLPPHLSYDERRLASFFALLPRTTRAAAASAAGHDAKVPEARALVDTPVDLPVRHALEVRHASFCSDRAVSFLAEHEVALVVADSPHLWPLLQRPTTDFMYLRLHGHEQLYTSGYSPSDLDMWARRVRSWLEEGRDCYAYFDNDSLGRAPYDALGLLERLGQTPATVTGTDWT
jgi:uncharacterized protein YecE (DUF72 family)